MPHLQHLCCRVDRASAMIVQSSVRDQPNDLQEVVRLSRLDRRKCDTILSRVQRTVAMDNLAILEPIRVEHPYDIPGLKSQTVPNLLMKSLCKFQRSASCVQQDKGCDSSRQRGSDV